MVLFCDESSVELMRSQIMNAKFHYFERSTFERINWRPRHGAVRGLYRFASFGPEGFPRCVIGLEAQD